MSAGAGSKGQRFYDWAWIAITPQPAKPTKTQPIDTSPGCWWLLIRRNNTTRELALYRCYSPAPVPLSRLVRVAGRRWRIEESFHSSKNLAGFDHHQVRRWNSWHRWTLLAMLAHALLAVLRSLNAAAPPATTTGPEAGIIDLTCNEIHRLFNHLRPPAHDIGHRLAWSRWRRRHQHRARTCHYARRGHTPPP